MSKQALKLQSKTLALSLLSLFQLSKKLDGANSYEDKVKVLDGFKLVKQYFKEQKHQLFEGLSLLQQYLLRVVILIDQQDVLDSVLASESKRDLEEFLQNLEAVEDFYDELGGLIGYQKAVLNLLIAHAKEDQPHEVTEKFFPPQGIDLTQPSKTIDEMVVYGIKSQGNMAEIYPVGGAADRLNLKNEETHFDLPAARLEFLGDTLLQGMIKDLQARESLHYKIFHKRVLTPIALMTSKEKNNDKLIREIFTSCSYFGRPKESFNFFTQPLVPTFTEDGKWCLKEGNQLLLKPGGHGVIWKLALKLQVFKWLKSKKCTKALIRQINNPIAGIDHGLPALIGIGNKEDRCFGFASCLRRVQTSEGINILKQEKVDDGYHIALSNIEYCDFKKFNIEDSPREKGDPYSVFPSNTNILFIDIQSIQEAVAHCPYPGMLVNFKEMERFQGKKKETAKVARLELLMQNIADGFYSKSKESLEKAPCDQLRTFMTFNKRHKTISPTKKQLMPGSGLVETAEGCFYDYLKSAKELLEQRCCTKLPALPKEEEFLRLGPSFIVKYHPSLGPLYSLIAQKVTSGQIEAGSELQLEVSELLLKDFVLDGSLIVKANNVTGHMEKGLLVYSDQVGKCVLDNVTIVNQGIDRKENNIFWKNKIYRKESLSITLEGNSYFSAQDVTFNGNYDICVPDNTFMWAKQHGDQVVFETRELTKKDQLWAYEVGSDFKLDLKKSNSI